MKKAVITILLAMALAGCDNPKIDGSSDEAMQTSIQKVRESLPEEKRATFDDALKVVAFSQLSMKDMMQAGMTHNPASVKDKMKDSLSGKSGEDVIAYAETVKKERAAKEKEQALQEISALESKQTAANQNLEQLAGLKITKSHFYIKNNQVGVGQPIIDLSVENGTPKVATRVYLEGVIASPGREVPWFRSYVDFKIPGGIEPGEKADWHVEPNMFSEWGKVNAPADAVFTLRVVRLDDVDGKPMFGNAWFTDEEAARLAQLKAKYSAD